MEIIIPKNIFESKIKDYYKYEYGAKKCRIENKVSKTKNKLQELDLFHSDQLHYNVHHTILIKGKLPDDNGGLLNFEDILTPQKIRTIFQDYYAENYRIIKMGYDYEFRNNEWGTNEAKIIFRSARFEVDELEKKPNKNINNKSFRLLPW